MRTTSLNAKRQKQEIILGFLKLKIWKLRDILLENRLVTPPRLTSSILRFTLSPFFTTKKKRGVKKKHSRGGCKERKKNLSSTSVQNKTKYQTL